MFNARQLGFPEITEDLLVRSADLSGKIMPWLPGMRTDVGDHLMVLRRQDHIVKALEAGVDPARIVVHHLYYDTGVITPLWGKDYFAKFCGKMAAWGVTKVVPPDFSSWADMPLVVQLHNNYRSILLARDYADFGFKLVPLIVNCAPQLIELQMSSWPDTLPVAVYDASHDGNTSSLNARMGRAVGEAFSSQKKCGRLLVWARRNNTARRVIADFGQGEFVPNSIHMRSLLLKAIRSAKK